MTRKIRKTAKIERVNGQSYLHGSQRDNERPGAGMMVVEAGVALFAARLKVNTRQTRFGPHRAHRFLCVCVCARNAINLTTCGKCRVASGNLHEKSVA
jgi:hypothetical protein